MGNPRGRPKKKKIGYRGADGRAAPKPKPAQQHELPPGAGDALSHDRGADLSFVLRAHASAVQMFVQQLCRVCCAPAACSLSFVLGLDVFSSTPLRLTASESFVYINYVQMMRIDCACVFVLHCVYIITVVRDQL